MTTAAISRFVERLAAAETGPACNNFFADTVPANAVRRRNLELYLQALLDRRPPVLLLGEAPGFRGMRLTGVPFTNRGMFTGAPNHFGLFGKDQGYDLPPEAAGVAAEPTATVMWEVLAELDFLPLLWSACPWHTHRPGQPQSNRTPSAAEAAGGIPFREKLMALFGISTVVAVGNIAHRSLLRSGVHAPKIRHPAHGGRAEFKRGLEELFDAGMPRQPPAPGTTGLGWGKRQPRTKGTP